MVLYSVLFLILAALAPPLILMGIIYRLDQIEREPPGLLWSLFLRGVLAMVPILVLEMLADQFIDFFYWRPMVYLFLAYFVVPGFIEEGIKYRVLRRRTWNEPNFNYRFDGVVYGVFVSLGFAAVENVMYVLTSGFSTAVVRAIFSIPGHAMFGVVMGAALGQAKWLAAHGQGQQAAAFLRRAWLLPAILHGAYDFLLVGFGWVFYLYFAGLVVYVLRLLRRSIREDVPIVGWNPLRGFPPGPGRGIQAFSKRKPGRKESRGVAPRPPFFMVRSLLARSFWRGEAQRNGRWAISLPMYVP